MNIAYCIPVYKHIEQLKEALLGSIEFLTKNNIDIYIYDSSPDDENRAFISSLMDSGYSNLYYIRIAEETIAAEKIFMIYAQQQMNKSYDYIWIVKDRSYWSKDLIDRVVKAIEDKPDAIVLHTIDNPNIVNPEYKEIYDSAEELYRDWAWLITSWDTCIFNVSTIFNRVNFEQLRERYYIDDDTNFPPVITLFSALNNSDSCMVKILEAQRNVHNFNAQFDETGRDEVLFKVWGYNWYHTNMNLPERYNKYKEYVIKSTASLPWLVGDRMRLVLLYHDGYLNDSKLNCVKDIWRYISDIPWSEVDLIKSGDMPHIEKCFVDVILQLIANDSIYYALYYYANSLWLVDNSCNREVRLVSYIMDIYLLEQQKLGYAHIFRENKSKDYLYGLIENVIKILKIIDDEGTLNDIAYIETIKNKAITKYMVLYLASQTCKDAEKVLKIYMSL